MKLTILVDNNTLIDRYFFGEPGVSYFIEDENKRILFDVGYSDLFIKNAQKLKINLLNLDFLVISHGHTDHTGGLESLIKLHTEAISEKLDIKKPTVIAHPEAFLTKTVYGLPEVGSLISGEKLSRHYQMKLNKKPIWITDKIVFLGEIERKNDFEAKFPIGKIIKSNSIEDDFLWDDSALVYKSENGLVIITGCSHSGICNIIEYAMKVCNDDRIIDVIGGFHLLNPSQKKMQGTLDYLKKQNLKKMHACHCTDLESKIALSKIVRIKEVGVGLKLNYEL
ncbi:MAG: MBL fold metallo-hydrolase [Candidatus Cloacimonetes bacterium]|nr:MBL fold metallo-hydrolase [Candidatus Cloacimonadota bacterium]